MLYRRSEDKLYYGKNTGRKLVFHGLERRQIFMVKYITPDQEVIYFESDDVLTTSTDVDQGEDDM